MAGSGLALGRRASWKVENAVKGKTMAAKKKRSTKLLMSELSEDDKEFFKQMIDVLHLFYRQRAALFAILYEQAAENWEPVYRIMQNDPEITKEADKEFAFFYESIGRGERSSAALKQLSKDAVKKWKPN